MLLWLANRNPAFAPFRELFDDSDLKVRPREGHMGSLDAAEEILDTILGLWPREERSRSERA